MKSKLIKTAYSNHNVCFICKSKNKSKRLSQVKQEAIIDVYKRLRIFIKHDARCCRKHFQNDGKLKDHCLINMPFKLSKQNSYDLLMLDRISKQQKPVFDYFKNLDLLNDKYCLKITGWCKKDFIRFCSFITSVKDSTGRSKEQLVALYRYWLRKGVDQTTLSLMFGNNTTQNQISHYLDQIRTAINKDFVSYFLGCKKGKAFFLAHNTLTAIELHEMGINDLAIVVDGTYCRCEKSSNNQFQYNTYSDQKKDSLIKPFLACTADGWIIDCYGPFNANKNDAKIFDYILLNDTDFVKILEPEKTILFLDRGFRDIFKKLLEELKLKAKIPTCKQLKDNDTPENFQEDIKQLTVQQTTESRLVTKCRYIIERINGMLKNFKALDNIRNTQIGHIQIDYRIACAMLNFTHKPCTSDKENTLKVAKNMKEKSKIKTNNLEFLLRKQLNTFDIPQVDLDSIKDFPKISDEQLKQEIFFGSFQFKESKSYFEDIIRNNKAYLVSNDFLKTNKDFNFKIPNSKIIAIEVPSRHKRSEKTKLSKKDEKKNFFKNFKNGYKVFIHYNPLLNGAESILGYICNCMSGRKILGTCVHVAASITYLSYAKYQYIEPKAKELCKILIDMDGGQKPNKPLHVRVKRRKISKNFETITAQSSLTSSKQNIISKNSLIKTKSSAETKISNFQEFKSHIPKWGAYIDINGEENIFVENTCSIDYCLLSLWYASKIKPLFLQKIPELEKTLILKSIILEIDKKRWDRARELWIDLFMKSKIRPNQNSISLFGSERDMFTQFIGSYQRYSLIQSCKNDCIHHKKIFKDRENIFFNKNNDKVQLDFKNLNICSICKSEIIFKTVFDLNPNFLFIQSKYLNIFIKDLPKIIEINGKNYRFMNTTVSISGHFKGIYDIDDKLYIVNDIGRKIEILKSIKYHGEKSYIENYFTCPTSTSFYYLE